jgi:hypothetical protein
MDKRVVGGHFELFKRLTDDFSYWIPFEHHMIDSLKYNEWQNME